MQQRNTPDPAARWADVVPLGRGWVMRYGFEGCALTACFSDESVAMRRACEWISCALEPDRMQTRTDWPAVCEEQVEAARWEMAAQALEARS